MKSSVKRLILPLALIPIAAPAFAAEAAAPFFSLKNPELIVAIGFILFLAILVYFKLPGMVGGLLDKRADTIRRELDEAKALREEAKALLASYEEKSREVTEQAARIVAQARDEAETVARQAHADLATAIERRMKAAGEKIASAETAAIAQVRQEAITVAISVAGEILARQTTAASAKAAIDDAIEQVEQRLH